MGELTISCEDVHRVGESMSGVYEACSASLDVFGVEHYFVKI